MTISDT